MCLYPTIIKNRKYTANKKNGGIIPPVLDQRTLYVPIGCQDCIECRKQKAREWQIRLMEDIKTNKNGKFITFTFSNESLKKIIQNEEDLKELKGLNELKGYTLDNAVATKAMRLFLERWRKKFKKSLRHWCVTELGQESTENIHIHGIVWTNETFETIQQLWNYGYIWPTEEHRKTNYVSEATINYITKYVTKKDEKHKLYKPIILTSPGIGNNYTKTRNAQNNKFSGTKTIETYKTRTGFTIALPIYWRNKIYTEKQREELWLQRLDKNERWICGERIDISKGEEEYHQLLKFYQKRNIELGYGNGQKSWAQELYEQQRRALLTAKRIIAAKPFRYIPKHQPPNKKKEMQNLIYGLAGQAVIKRVRII